MEVDHQVWKTARVPCGSTKDATHKCTEMRIEFEPMSKHDT